MVEGDLPGTPKRRAENITERWGYETHFREYALLLGRKGLEGLESINNFPDRIGLDEVWHKPLNG